jgi:hypothetical protein
MIDLVVMNFQVGSIGIEGKVHSHCMYYYGRQKVRDQLIPTTISSILT